MDIEKEIGDLAENVKSTHTTLNTAFEELKASTAEAHEEFMKKGDVDPLIEAKNKKIIADVLKCQEAIDIANTKLNRPSLGINSYDDMDKKNQEATLFFKGISKSRMEGKDVVIGSTKVIEKGTANIEIFNAYDIAFKEHMRTPDLRLLAPEYAKALSVGSDPDGGFTVTPQMSNSILERQFEMSPMRRVVNVESISTMVYQIITDPEEYTANRVAEKATNANTGTGSFGRKEIVAHALEARPKSTPEMVEDSMFNIEAHIAAKIGKKFARVEAAEFVTGDGVDKARGVTSYPNGTTWGNSIERLNSGVNGGVSYPALAAIATSLKEGYYANARWLLNRMLIGQVLALTGNSTPLWIPSIAVGQPSTLLGFPVDFAQDFATPATNSLSGSFGDHRAGYTWVDRKGISINPDPYTDKPNIEYYARSRSGGDVVDTDAIKLIQLSA